MYYTLRSVNKIIIIIRLLNISAFLTSLYILALHIYSRHLVNSSIFHLPMKLFNKYSLLNRLTDYRLPIQAGQGGTGLCQHARDTRERWDGTEICEIREFVARTSLLDTRSCLVQINVPSACRQWASRASLVSNGLWVDPWCSFLIAVAFQLE